MPMGLEGPEFVVVVGYVVDPLSLLFVCLSLFFRSSSFRFLKLLNIDRPAPAVLRPPDVDFCSVEVPPLDKPGIVN